MSHTTVLDTVPVRDLDALMKAVEQLKGQGVKCEVIENAKPRMYSTSQGPTCEYVVRLSDGRYDVGFKLQDDGSYSAVFDEYQHHVANQLGADVNVCPMPTTREGRAQHQIGKLMQAYSEHAAGNAARAQGYVVESSKMDAKGQVHMVIGNVG